MWCLAAMDGENRRIVIINEATNICGVRDHYENIIRRLRNHGHEIREITPDDIPLKFRAPGQPDVMLAFDFNAKMAGRIIESFNPHHVHIATEGPLGWSTLFWARSRRGHVTTAYHTDWTDYAEKRLPEGFKVAGRLAMARLLSSFHNRSDGVMVASKMMEAALRHMGVNTPTLPQVKGVDTDIFYPGEVTDDEVLAAFGNKPVALYFGRVTREKNIEAFLKLDTPGFQKVVMGEGPDRERLTNICPPPGVIYVGFKRGRKLGEYLRRASVVVGPSQNETFGQYIIQANACGLPVAAYDTGGHTFLLKNPIFGSTAPDLQDAFFRAVNAPGTSEERFRERAAEFSWDRAAKTFVESLVPFRN
ncbi:MAG: glycosyltransferase family 1 protein [Alphaproteobacteria bacterium]|nr:glycosyltransferase family 1 protein [Alphaproteobacteria bacterium]